MIKAINLDSSGVSPLKENGKLLTETSEKSNALNRQFQSVITSETSKLPPNSLENKFHPTMPDIHITQKGFEKLLMNLNPNKATGPDSLSPRILKELSSQIAPILTKIFQMFLETDGIPEDWRKANVSPIFKKGEKYNPANYRPVLLTCICSKLMEHILVSNIMTHLEEHDILYRQHGFRSKRSTET